MMIDLLYMILIKTFIMSINKQNYVYILFLLKGCLIMSCLQGGMMGIHSFLCLHATCLVSSNNFRRNIRWLRGSESLITICARWIGACQKNPLHMGTCCTRLQIHQKTISPFNCFSSSTCCCGSDHLLYRRRLRYC